MKTKFLIFFPCLFLLMGAVFAALLLQPVAGEADAAAANRIAAQAGLHWGSWADGDFAGLPYSFAILDQDEDLVYQRGESVSVSISAAVRSRDAILDVYREGRPVGKVLIATGADGEQRRKEERMAIWAVCFSLCAALLAFFCFLAIHIAVLSPFQKLRKFARSIAAGNLEAPLQMDRSHLFGPFTESFDLMRDRLAQARLREAKAAQSKKELVASLSHDIRTPVTSIRLIAELLRETVPQENVKERLSIICGKADQIDALITNLFHSSLEELDELSVSVSEESSQILEAMLRGADDRGSMDRGEIPGCLIRIDPMRLEQVLNNIVHNSRKYAGTAIRVRFHLTDEFLLMDIDDFGPGVAEEELPCLTNKFYRGKNAEFSHTEGAGLGLYLSRYFMEKMGGGLCCRVRADGFTVELLIPLV